MRYYLATVACILLVFYCIGCEKIANKSNNPTISARIDTLTNNTRTGIIKNITTPTIGRSGDYITFTDSGGRGLFSYNTSSLLDLDSDESSVAKRGTDEDIEIVNAAIQGLFGSGIYDTYADLISSQRGAEILSRVQIAKPIRIRELDPTGDDYFFVHAIYDRKILATARVDIHKEDGGTFKLTGWSRPTSSLKDLDSISISDSTGDTIANTKQQSFRIASLVIPGFRSRSTRARLVRVHFSNDMTTAMDYLWVEDGKTSGYFITSNGDVVVASAGHSIQSIEQLRTPELVSLRFVHRRHLGVAP